MILGDAAAQSNLTFFKEMKKVLYEKSSGQDIPDKLEGKVSHDDILDKFKECYEQLYNSAPSVESMLKVKEDISRTISDNVALSEIEIAKITPDVVKAAAANMKPHKSDVSESFTSDVFLHGPDIMFEYLTLVFKSFLVHGTISNEVLCCAFLPLYKGGLKNPEKFDSYIQSYCWLFTNFKIIRVCDIDTLGRQTHF